jgi:hypothetical protein
MRTRTTSLGRIMWSAALATGWITGCSAQTRDFRGDSGGTASSSSAGMGGMGAGGGGGDSSGGGAMGESSSSTGTTGNGCGPDTPCGPGLRCCGGLCANVQNDILNCGSCGVTCLALRPYCGGGVCGSPPCDATPCLALDFCCGQACCTPDTLCCDVPGGGPSSGPSCVKPVNNTCPVGCPACQ